MSIWQSRKVYRHIAFHIGPLIICEMTRQVKDTQDKLAGVAQILEWIKKNKKKAKGSYLQSSEINRTATSMGSAGELFMYLFFLFLFTFQFSFVFSFLKFKKEVQIRT